MKTQVKKLCPVGTKIQSVIFDKDNFTKQTAKAWAKKHDMVFSYVDEKENTYRIRQHEPISFKKGTFRTINLTDGVQAVIGCPVKSADMTIKKYVGGGGVKTDFYDYDNTDFRNALLSFWDDFFSSEISYYLNIEKEDYVFDDENSLFVLTRNRELGDFSPVEKERFNLWFEPYSDSTKKSEISKFIKGYSVKGNTILINLNKSEAYKDGGVTSGYVPKTQSELVPLPSSISYTMFSGQDNFSRDVNVAGHLFVDISQNTKTSYRINIQIGESRFSINQNVEGLKYIEKNEYNFGTGRHYTAYYLKPKTFMDFVYHIEKVLERALPEINLNGLVLKFYRRWFLDNIISNTPSTEQSKIFSPKTATAPVQQPESTEQVTAEVTEQVQQSSQTETVSGYPLEYLQQKFREKESIQRNFRKPDNWNTTYDIWEELTIKGRKNFLKWAGGDDNSIGKGVVLDEAQADAIANTDYRNADLSLLTKAQVVAWIFFTKYAISKGDVKKWNSESMPQFSATQQVEEQVEDEVKQEVETDKSTPDKEVKYARLTLKQVREKFDNYDSVYQRIQRYIKWHEGKSVMLPLGIEKDILLQNLESLKRYKRMIFEVWTDMREKGAETISENKVNFDFPNWSVFNYSWIILRCKYVINFTYLNGTNTVDDKFYSGAEISSMEGQIENALSELCKELDRYDEYLNYMKTITDKKAEGRDYAYVLAQYGEDKYSTVVLALTDYMQGQENRWSGYEIIYRTDVSAEIKNTVIEQVEKVDASADDIRDVIKGLQVQAELDPQNTIYQDVIDGLKVQLELMGEQFKDGGETLKGGKGDNMTLEQIAELHGVDMKQILYQATLGRKIEREHSSDPNRIYEIVKDHLVESPKYYSLLTKMEKSFENGGYIDIPSQQNDMFRLQLLMSVRGATKNTGVLQEDGTYRYSFDNDMDLNEASIISMKLLNPDYSNAMPSNLNQLKKYIQVGTLLRISYNRFRPNRVGTINVVVKTQTNGFYLADGTEVPETFDIKKSVWFEYPPTNKIQFSPFGYTIFGMAQGETLPVKTLEYQYVTGVQEDRAKSVSLSDEELSKEVFDRMKYLDYMSNSIDNIEGFYHGGRLKPDMFNNGFEINLDTQSVSCFIIAQNTGRMLLLKRGKGDHTGTWSLVSGMVETGELPQDAIKREIQEELNLDLNFDKLKYLDSTKHPHSTHFFYEYFVKDEFAPTLNDENLTYIWVNMNQLPNNMHPLLFKYIKSSMLVS